MTHKAMKFRVKNPEHSKAIQERLFQMGYKWWHNNKTEIGQVNSKYLFADIRDMRITDIVDNEDYFINHTYTETTLEEITEWTPKQGEMIEVRDHDEQDWQCYEFLFYDSRLKFPYRILSGNASEGFIHARPLNPIRTEIEELKARLNELEAKL